jgi:hypothetical protein
MLFFEVVDGFVELVQVHVEKAEVSVRHTLRRPVPHLLGNRQVLRVEIDSLAKVAHAEVVPPPHGVDNVLEPLIASD